MLRGKRRGRGSLGRGEWEREEAGATWWYSLRRDFSN